MKWCGLATSFKDERLGLQLWEGPGVFRAGSFARPIYRKEETERVEVCLLKTGVAHDRRPHRCAGQLGLRRASSCVTPGKTQRSGSISNHQTDSSFMAKLLKNS